MEEESDVLEENLIAYMKKFRNCRNMKKKMESVQL